MQHSPELNNPQNAAIKNVLKKNTLFVKYSKIDVQGHISSVIFKLPLHEANLIYSSTWTFSHKKMNLLSAEQGLLELKLISRAGGAPRTGNYFENMHFQIIMHPVMLISTSFFLMQYAAVPLKKILQSNSMAIQACGSLAPQVTTLTGMSVVSCHFKFKVS